MTAATAAPIPACCPECGRTASIFPGDLGRALVCEGCATPFSVRRERRRRHDPRAIRSRSLEELCVGTGRPDGAETVRVLSFMGVLLLLAAATPLLLRFAPVAVDAIARALGAR